MMFDKRVILTEFSFEISRHKINKLIQWALYKVVYFMNGMF